MAKMKLPEPTGAAAALQARQPLPEDDTANMKISAGLRAWHAKRTLLEKARTQSRRNHSWKAKHNLLRGKFSSYLPADDDLETDFGESVVDLFEGTQ